MSDCAHQVIRQSLPTHKPLQFGEIRLIELSSRDVIQLKACDHETLSLTLQVFALSEAPPFTALSYCWGDSKDKRAILCNGQPFEVPDNFVTALRRVMLISPINSDSLAERHNQRVPNVYLWADAICINQSDIDEKNWQVPFMRDVYEAAENVKVYLGQSDDACKVREAMNTAMDFVRGDLAADIKALINPQMRLSTASISAIVRFFACPAFRRRWIIQEIVLGKAVQLYYGKETFSMQDIEVFNKCANEKNMLGMRVFEDSPPQDGNQDMLGLYYATGIQRIKLQRVPEQCMSFIEILILTRGSQATDTRDNVYALLGLAEDHYKSNIDPDYSSRTSAREVFTQVARLTLTSPREQDFRRNLQVVGLYSEDIHGIMSLPSWVPDWTVLGCTPFDFELFDCSGDSRLSVQLKGKDTIILKGAIIDEVNLTGLMWSDDKYYTTIEGHPATPYPMDAVVIIHDNLLQLTHQISTSAYSGGIPTMEDAVFLTLMSGQPYHCTPVVSDRQYYEAYSRAVSSKPVTPERKLELKRSFDFFTVAVARDMSGRRTCVTRNGYLGTVSGQVRSGDVIAIISGMEMPFVLREKQDEAFTTGRRSRREPSQGNSEGKRYELMGPCYICGIMDADLVEGIADDGIVKVRGMVTQDLMIV